MVQDGFKHTVTSRDRDSTPLINTYRALFFFTISLITVEMLNKDLSSISLMCLIFFSLMFNWSSGQENVCIVKTSFSVFPSLNIARYNLWD